MSENARTVGVEIRSSYDGTAAKAAIADQEKLAEAGKKQQSEQLAAAEAYERKKAEFAERVRQRELREAALVQKRLDEESARLKQAANDAEAYSAATARSASALGVFAAAVGVGIAASAAAINMHDRWNREINSTNSLLIANGRATEISRAQVIALSEDLSRASNVNRTEALSTIGTLSGLRGINAGLMTDLARLNTDFATAIGEKPAQAARQLGKAFEDPAKGARALDQQLNILSADQLLLIDRMTAQGRVLEAQKVLYGALHQRISGLTAQGMTPLEAASKRLGNAWDGLWDRFLKSEYFKTAEDRVSRMMGWLSAILEPSANPERDLSGRPVRPRGNAPGNNNAALLDKQVKDALNAGGRYDPGARNRELNDVATQIRSAMSGLEAAGKTDSEAYQRLKASLGGVNEQLNPKGKTGRPSPRKPQDRVAEDAFRAEEQVNDIMADAVRYGQRFEEAESRRAEALERSAQSYREAIDPAEQWRKKMKELDEHQRASAMFNPEAMLSADTYAALMEEYSRKAQEATLATEGMNKAAKGAADGGIKELKNAMYGWGRETSRELARMAVDGEISLKRLSNAAKNLVVDLIAARIQKQFFEKPINDFVDKGMGFLGDVLGSVFGGGAPTGGGTEAIMVAHQGGVVGEHYAGRYVHPAHFEGARRMHRGGIAGDEVPTVLQRGEEVITRQDPRHRYNGGGAPNIKVEIINQGRPQEVVSATPSFDVEGMVVRLVTRDLSQGGPIRAGVENVARGVG